MTSALLEVENLKVTFPTAGTGLSLTVTDQNDATITGSETGITVV